MITFWPGEIRRRVPAARRRDQRPGIGFCKTKPVVLSCPYTLVSLGSYMYNTCRRDDYARRGKAICHVAGHDDEKSRAFAGGTGAGRRGGRRAGFALATRTGG